MAEMCGLPASVINDARSYQRKIRDQNPILIQTTPIDEVSNCLRTFLERLLLLRDSRLDNNGLRNYLASLRSKIDGNLLSQMISLLESVNHQIQNNENTRSGCEIEAESFSIRDNNLSPVSGLKTSRKYNLDSPTIFHDWNSSKDLDIINTGIVPQLHMRNSSQMIRNATNDKNSSTDLDELDISNSGSQLSKEFKCVESDNIVGKLSSDDNFDNLSLVQNASCGSSHFSEFLQSDDNDNTCRLLASENKILNFEDKRIWDQVTTSNEIERQQPHCIMASTPKPSLHSTPSLAHLQLTSPQLDDSMARHLNRCISSKPSNHNELCDTAKTQFQQDESCINTDDNANTIILSSVSDSMNVSVNLDSEFKNDFANNSRDNPLESQSSDFVRQTSNTDLSRKRIRTLD